MENLLFLTFFCYFVHNKNMRTKVRPLLVLMILAIRYVSISVALHFQNTLLLKYRSDINVLLIIVNCPEQKLHGEMFTALQGIKAKLFVATLHSIKCFS